MLCNSFCFTASATTQSRSPDETAVFDAIFQAMRQGKDVGRIFASQEPSGPRVEKFPRNRKSYQLTRQPAPLGDPYAV